MSRIRKLECGCAFVDSNVDPGFTPCPAHIGTPLYKVRKMHAEVVQMVTCNNCGADKVPGQACFQCGEPERVGP